MGVDIAMIIPTKQRSKRNHEECVRCLNDAVTQVELFFHRKKHFVSSKYIKRENEDLLNEFSSEELDMYSFYVPFLDGSDFCLFAGFWCITNGYRYWQYFSKRQDKRGNWRSYQRELFFDAVHMLGGKEGWLCDDLNVEEFADYKDDAFDACIRHEEGKPWGVVHDFDISEAKNVEVEGFLDYWPKYHDSFKECF